jgi:hypothetical protein
LTDEQIEVLKRWLEGRAAGLCAEADREVATPAGLHDKWYARGARDAFLEARLRIIEMQAAATMAFERAHAGGFDYGDPDRNRAEAERVKEEGRTAARNGASPFGAGGHKPGDMHRAHFWLLGFAEVNPAHPDLPERYRGVAHA